MFTFSKQFPVFNLEVPSEVPNRAATAEATCWNVESKLLPKALAVPISLVFLVSRLRSWNAHAPPELPQRTQTGCGIQSEHLPAQGRDESTIKESLLHFLALFHSSFPQPPMRAGGDRGIPTEPISNTPEDPVEPSMSRSSPFTLHL